MKVGIAPINWTNDDLPDLGKEISFEQCIREMSQSGYAGCEVGTKFPTDVEVLKKALVPLNLCVCNKWMSYDLFYLDGTPKKYESVEQCFRSQCEFLQSCGAQVMGGAEVSTSIHSNIDIPLFESPVILTGDQWNTLCRTLNVLGKIAHEEYGIKLAYHHHLGTCVQNLKELVRLLENTDEQYVYVNYDCGHFFAADQDPIEALQQVVTRVAHVHLKDVRAEVLSRVKSERLSFLEGIKAGLFTVPGDGAMRTMFTTIATILKNQLYDGWLVVEAEQDPAKANPKDYAVQARAFVRDNFGY